MYHVDLPSRRYIKDQIFREGSRNDLRYLNNKIAFNVWGYMKSYISFVPAKQLNVSKYSQAVDSLNAALLKLQKIELYASNHPEDKLWSFYYDLFKRYVETGDPNIMDQLKLVLWFVKYPETGSVGDYTLIPYAKLYELALYKTTKDYPWDYIEMYDIINEWDIVITDDIVTEYLDKYKESYLADQVYQTANVNGLADALDPAISILIYKIKKKKGLMRRMQRFLENPSQYRMGKVGNAKCGTGNKRDFFGELYTRGISPNARDICFGQIDRLNKIYHTTFPYPDVKDTGLQLDEYCMRLMVLPDPKKGRYAFQSNPIMDYIGYYAMDFLALLFEAMPWIKTGHKRVTPVDQLEDHSRYEDTKRVYTNASQYNIDLMSTDLSKATENQNMDVEIEVIHRIVDGIGLSQFWDRLKESLLQLKDTPIILCYPKNTLRPFQVYYTRWGQCQGIPGSFHAMTVVLALSNFQTLLEDGKCIHLTKGNKGQLFKLACEILQNNGDDGNNLSSTINKFKELLELLTDPDHKREDWSKQTGIPKEEVFNAEKSCSMTVNGSLEFCKSMYYSHNPDLVVGYRMSSVYKMLGGGITSQRYLTYSRFRHDKDVFCKMAREMKDLVPTITQYPSIFDKRWRRLDTVLLLDERSDILSELVDDVYAIRINRLSLTSQKLDNIVGNTFNVPESALSLLHHNSYFHVIEEGLLSISDMQTMDALFESLDSHLYNDGGITPEEAFLDSTNESDLFIWRMERKILDPYHVKRYDAQFQLEGNDIMVTTLDVPKTLRDILGSSTIVLTTREIDTRSFRQVCSELENKHWATIAKYGSIGLETTLEELSIIGVESCEKESTIVIEQC